MTEIVVLTKEELKTLVAEAAQAAAEAAVAAIGQQQIGTKPMGGLTVDEVAAETGISPTAIYAAIKRKKLKATRAGRHYRIHSDSVAAWLKN